MMKIYIVRHTTPINYEKICYGSSDLDLADTFEEESQVVLSKLPKQIDHIYTSPLSRCRLLASKIGDPYTIEPRLKEFDFGDWEKIPWANLPKIAIDQWKNNLSNFQAPNGDSMPYFSSKIVLFLNFLKKQPMKNVVVVTHGGVIKTMIHIINKIPIRQAMSPTPRFWRY